MVVLRVVWMAASKVGSLDDAMVEMTVVLTAVQMVVKTEF